MSESPVSPSTPFLRRRPVTRACDRCRRRKAKCDVEASRGRRCSQCRDADEDCTFDLPLAKRGPKSKKASHRGSLANPATPQAVSPDQSLLSNSDIGNGAQSFTSLANLNSVPWEPSVTSPLGHALSPPNLGSTVSESSNISALQRWHQLSRALSLRSFDIDQIVDRCLQQFFEYLYPLTPLVHEPSLRDGLALFLNPQTVGNTLAQVEAWPEATFTLITAVCAEAAFLLPKDIFPEGEAVAALFLQASRDCLNSYLEADLENPNANSIAIRYFHSNCIHAAGKPKYSWHIFGEATRLAQVMQLHEESALEGLYPIEAELRRRAFWIVYMGDKSAAILNNRPIAIHKFSFESGISTAYPNGIEDESPIGISPGSADVGPEAGRRSFIAGFNANLKLWQAASELILEMRLLQDQQRTDMIGGNKTLILSSDQRAQLDSLYIRFITCLDDLPPYLQSYTFAAIATGGAQTSQTKQFIIQCANLQVSLHCLRMVITQKFEDMGLTTSGTEQPDLRKTEIARDMLRVMHEAPFWSLQVNGEPYVEKIRLIGASLLAIIHRNPNSPLSARARSDFSVLLDILTRLDSKASDALRNNSTTIL